MAAPDRPVRADAARNRARVLEVAYQTFAVDGLSVPIDEIARRAGVGAGTVYRHFPTKEALFQAVIADRMRHIIADGNALLESQLPGEALYTFMRSMVLQWGAADRGLVEALAGVESTSTTPSRRPRRNSWGCWPTYWAPRNEPELRDRT